MSSPKRRPKPPGTRPARQSPITRSSPNTRWPGGRRFVSKLRLRLETGRKHQIRVQAANAGLPLVGDRTYNPGFRAPDPANPPIDFPRQALHAEVLSLEHPDQPGTRMAWTAELPKDLRQLEASSAFRPALRSGAEAVERRRSGRSPSSRDPTLFRPWPGRLANRLSTRPGN